MRFSLIISLAALLLIRAPRSGQAQPPDPTLLRITFVAATPPAPPEFTPTPKPTAPTPTITPTGIPAGPTPTGTPPAVPEPATLTLFGLGAAAVATAVRHQRRRNGS